MANARKKKGRRAARRGGAPEPSAARRGRRRGVPERELQPGKRPSSPAMLLFIALAWIACGVYALIGLKASWKFVPGIFFIGVGVLFLRGAAVTVVRRSER